MFTSDLAAFREIFSRAKNIAILTGAGVSAESGVPTFRGAGGLWRKWKAQVGTYQSVIFNADCFILHHFNLTVDKYGHVCCKD